MNKLTIAMKFVGCVVVGLILAGLFNPVFLTSMMPFIIGGTAITLALYIINAFKSKNYGTMAIILIMAAFVAVILGYNYLH